MITEVKVDGIYRPEQLVNDKWLAVAYIGFRGTVLRKVHCETNRGRTEQAQFDWAIEAQKVCDQLNNVQSTQSTGLKIAWHRENIALCESSGLAREIAQS